MHHTLVCLGLNHYIHALPPGANRAVVASNRSKIYKYRGQAIRALSENVANEKTRSLDLTISSILMFMAMEVSLSCLNLIHVRLIEICRSKILAWETGDRMLMA
jgi:hypothetical protein